MPDLRVPMLATLILLGVVGLLGCTHPVRKMYAAEFACSVETTKVTSLGGGRTRVSGCAGEMVYQCFGKTCFPDERELRGKPKASDSVQTSRSTAAVRRTKHVEGYTVLASDVQLGQGVVLQLRSAPERYPDISLLALTQYNKKWGECELMLMVNAQRISVEKAAYTRKSGREALTFKIARRLMLDIRSARQLAFRACDQRWTLDANQTGQVSQFVDAVEEDLAWAGTARSGTMGSLLAPSSGWVAWGVPSLARPQPIGEEALEGDELYRRLVPSVYTIEAFVEGGTSQGSAVAVSPHEMLTNCHVVAGGKRLVAKQGKVEFAVELFHADPESDRCILIADEVELHPVSGVRSFADLKVGESAYTLGSPQGLDATLASGIISGLRDDETRKLVQTTAPISPGSSGGGLFDRRGNLIGITQMVRVDAERISQALNFAIPADAFWIP